MSIYAAHCTEPIAQSGGLHLYNKRYNITVPMYVLFIDNKAKILLVISPYFNFNSPHPHPSGRCGALADSIPSPATLHDPK
jgi:hypothetical protein